MSDNKIRPMVFVVFRRNDQVLVWTGRDDNGQPYHRLIGGGITFGETAAAAASREVREELGITLSELRFLGVVEDIFSTDQGPHHEIGLVFEGSANDPAWYAQDHLRMLDHPDIEIVWRPLSTDHHTIPLYPTGVLDLLTTSHTTPRYVPATSG